MRLKSSRRELVDQCLEISSQCLSSQQDRIDSYVRWRNYLFTGTPDVRNAAILNKIGSHIDRLASFLFAPAEVRFLVEFGQTADKRWQDKEVLISRKLSDEYHAGNCDLAFSEANSLALVYGSTFVKQLWDPNHGLVPYVITPNQMGVMREDIGGAASSLDRQEAFTHVTYFTKDALYRRLKGHPERDEIMRKANRYNLDRTTDDIDNIVHQVIIGGVTPVQVGSPTGTRGSVDVFNYSPTPQLSADVARDLVRFVEIWVNDDEREDWTCLQYIEPDVLIEGAEQKRNIFLPGEQPFIQVMPNAQHGYFWGRSEIADLQKLQDVLTDRLNDINHIWHLRSHPPRGISGVAALTDEMKRAFSSPDGLIAMENPQAKFENLAPDLPQEAFAQVDTIIKYLDDTAGFAPVLMGQGEPGVRTGVQADSLNRTASARMRDRALVVERQCAAHGALCLDLLEAKDATVFGQQGQGFLLGQMPEDRKTTVDSHSSSPAFTQDHRGLAFALHKAGAITPEGLLMLTNPPQLDMLMNQLAAKEKQQQELIKEHPELLQKAAGKKR